MKTYICYKCEKTVCTFCNETVKPQFCPCSKTNPEWHIAGKPSEKNGGTK